MRGFAIAATIGALAVLGFSLSGCEEPPSLPLVPIEPANPGIGTAFDPDNVGTIKGQVFWGGPIPEVKPFVAPVSANLEGHDRTLRSWANPHAPAIDPAGNGLAEAIVYLRGVDPHKARPWDHPSVRVESRQGQLNVYQGATVTRTGFLAPGDSIEMVSRETWLEFITGREAAYFSLPFPDPDQPITRRLDRPGRVELASGAGHYWMRAHLFVADHPYFARTDSKGRFTLSQVPTGEYEIVCWHPNWHVGDFERDLGTFYIFRMTYRPAVERCQSVRVEKGGTASATFTLSAKAFEP